MCQSGSSDRFPFLPKEIGLYVSGCILCRVELPAAGVFKRRVRMKSGEEQKRQGQQSSGQRWLPAIHLWFQDSKSADRSGSPGTGPTAVTTDTQTNQELSLKRYQQDTVTGDGKTG